MKYIKTYEINWNIFKKEPDYQKIFALHLTKFIEDQKIPYLKVSELETTILVMKKGQILVQMYINKRKNYITLTIDYFIDIHPELKNILEFLKDTLKDFHDIYKNNEPTYMFVIVNSKVQNAIDSINSENFEYFNNIKKYNL